MNGEAKPGLAEFRQLVDEGSAALELALRGLAEQASSAGVPYDQYCAAMLGAIEYQAVRLISACQDIQKIGTFAQAFGKGTMEQVAALRKPRGMVQ